MAVELDIRWEGRSASDFARVFDTAANLWNFKPVLKQIGTQVVGPSVAANFAAGGRPAWAPLAPSTIKRKSDAGVSNPGEILVHSGAMRTAATNAATGYLYHTDMMRAFPRGTTYWKHHQTGTPKMPQRVMMMLQSQDRTKINTLFAAFVRSHMVFDPRQPGARQFTGGGVGLGT